MSTTHILYNPKRGDIKLAQFQMLLANLDRAAFKACKLVEGKLVPSYYPTILCGDFNCVHDSKLYEFLATARLVDYKNLNRNTLSGQYETSRNATYIERLLPRHLGISDQSQFLEEVNKRLGDQLNRAKKLCEEEGDKDYEIQARTSCTFGGQNLAHCFAFSSAYKHYDDEFNKEVTSCVNDFHKTVDYIFFHSESNNLKLLGRLELFTEDRLQDVCLPEKNYPSDHFLLAAKFVIE